MDIDSIVVVDGTYGIDEPVIVIAISLAKEAIAQVEGDYLLETGIRALELTGKGVVKMVSTTETGDSA